MFEISGGTKADRTFLESYLIAKKPEDKINEGLKNFRRTLEILPLARVYIESEDYSGLFETIQNIIDDIKNDTRLDAWLDTEYKCRQLIEMQESKEPMNQQSRQHSNWSRELGRLEGHYESISATLSHLRKTVFEPSNAKVWAIEILEEHIRDRIVWEDQEIKRLKQEIAMDKIVKSILEAKERGDDFVSIPVTKDGKNYVKKVPTVLFFTENSEEDLRMNLEMSQLVPQQPVPQQPNESPRQTTEPITPPIDKTKCPKALAGEIGHSWQLYSTALDTHESTWFCVRCGAKRTMKIPFVIEERKK